MPHKVPCRETDIVRHDHFGLVEPFPAQVCRGSHRVEFAISDFPKSKIANSAKLFSRDRPRSRELIRFNVFAGRILDFGLSQGRARRLCCPSYAAIPCQGMTLAIGIPARPRAFPSSSLQRAGRQDRTRAMTAYAREAVAVGAAPAESKRHEVGRVARRARPDISSHYSKRPRLTVKAGSKAGLMHHQPRHAVVLVSRPSCPYLKNAFSNCIFL